MSDDQIFEGGCLCGAVRHRATKDPIGVVNCHCKNCQKHTGAPFVTSVGFSGDAFSWIGEKAPDGKIMTRKRHSTPV